MNDYSAEDRLIPYASDGVHERVLELLPTSGRVLDVAAGSGHLCIKMQQRGLEVKGCDINPSKYFRLDIQNLDEGLSYKNESFDIVTAIEIIEHLHNPWNMLEEAHRVLKTGGELIVSLPNISNFMARLVFLKNGRWPMFFGPLDEKGHINAVTFEEMKIVLEDLGFEIDGIKTNKKFSSLMLPVMKLFMCSESAELLQGEILVIKARKVRP
ncbi:MAG: class I SAM-dependent methyltransferase [Candidatus Diapherotrites archaeon]|nr:class I SAM-dependent methyltransferase [Candidatus Diapherotrites archaeon]